MLKYFQAHSWLVGASLGVRDIFPPKVIVSTAAVQYLVLPYNLSTTAQYQRVTRLGGASLGDSFQCVQHSYKVLLYVYEVGLKCLLLLLHMRF